MNPEELKSIAKEVMDSAYGAKNFEATRSCWKYSLECWSLHFSELVNRQSGQECSPWIYLQRPAR
ncbi:hypothetical protein XacyCFBP1159_07905 [Xanthomonas arboricola pv. corylina]|nr:hypothetical protein XacyCFBP1159_07905 [Xanthomonas arboricola pv. corylina]